MPKVHKLPAPMVLLRPVVAQCGSFVTVLSIFLDYVLQPLKNFSLVYTKDLLNLIMELLKIGPIPDGNFLFTLDAESMYMNIDPNEGLAILRLYFIEFKDELPDSFHVDFVLELLEL
eukprot:707084-Ditylum_brightwellii.AAC.1